MNPDPRTFNSGLARPGEIHRADPGARRRAILILLAGVLAGAAALAVLPAIERWLVSDPSGLDQYLAIAVCLFALLLCLPLLAVAARVWARGTKVKRQERFPLDDDVVIRDAPVLRGQAALVRGRILQALAVALGASALLLVAAMWRFAVLFVASGP